jgi:hypothetical protein
LGACIIIVYPMVKMANKPSDMFMSYLGGLLKKEKPGSPLPTDKELAAQWGLSERSIRRLLIDLRDQGRIIRIPGKGSFLPGGKSKESPLNSSGL